jgi:hypothetical protein
MSSDKNQDYPCSPICAGYLRAEAADARAERLRVALERIDSLKSDDPEYVESDLTLSCFLKEIARKAIRAAAGGGG